MVRRVRLVADRRKATGTQIANGYNQDLHNTINVQQGVTDSDTATRNAGLVRDNLVTTLVWVTISKEPAFVSLLWQHFMWENQHLCPSCMRFIHWSLRVPQNHRNPRKTLSEEVKRRRTERSQVRSWRCVFSREVAGS